MKNLRPRSVRDDELVDAPIFEGPIGHVPRVRSISSSAAQSYSDINYNLPSDNYRDFPLLQFLHGNL